MITVLIYLMIATTIGSLHFRLSDYQETRYNPPKAFMSFLLGAFWPATGPCWACYILINKLVDRFDKS